MIRSYVESFLASYPLVCLVSWLAGWQLNILQQLALTVTYVCSSMSIHLNTMRMIGTILKKKGEDKRSER